MISRFSMPLSQQTFGARPMGINSPPSMAQPGNFAPYQNSQQMAGFGGQRYGVTLPQGLGQQMQPGLLSGYLDFYKNYRAPYQAPPVMGSDSVGIAYQQKLAADAAAKAVEDMAAATSVAVSAGA